MTNTRVREARGRIGELEARNRELEAKLRMQVGLSPGEASELTEDVARVIAEFAAETGPVDAYHTAKVLVKMFEERIV